MSGVSVRDRAKAALREALRRAQPTLSLDRAGYCLSPQDNLLLGLRIADIAAEFGAGAGAELRSKFRAPHSSSALAVNSFAGVRSAGTTVVLACEPVRIDGFESKQPTGLPNAQPPHLDVIASSVTARVAIESKCLEPLSPKRPSFSRRYLDLEPTRGRSRWFGEMRRIMDGDAPYRHLDVAQLIKHALGLLANAAPGPTTLLYLFWEPLDAADWPVFAAHRCELETFAHRLAGDPLRFAWQDYGSLWSEWSGSDHPMMRATAAQLQRRYAVRLD